MTAPSDIIAKLRAVGKALPVWPEAELKDNTFELYYDCPLCGGEGTLPGELCGDKAAMSWAGGVQFYGIGAEHVQCEVFYNAARDNWDALLDVVEAARAALKRADIIGVWPDGHTLTFSDMESALARLTDQSADRKEAEG
jgi:hypothetical protein